MKKEIALACTVVACVGAREAFGGLLYEPSCYVAQDSLAINFDGIRNVGALKAHDGAATEWMDLSYTANNATFIAKEGDASAWTADGFTLGGKEYYGGRSYVQMSGSRTLDGPYTIQEVLDLDRERANRINVPWPGLMGTTDTGDKLAYYYNMPNVGTPDVRLKVMNTYLYQISGWGGDYVTAIFNGTQTASFKGATTEGVTWKAFTYVPGATADHDAAATTWADLANGNDATFDFANAGVTGDGWTDNGYRFVYGGKFAELPDTLNFGSVVTIQAVCDVGRTGKPSGDSWQTLFGATNDYCNIYTGDGNGNTIVFKIFNNQAQVKDANNAITTYTGGRQQMSGTWTGKYMTAIWSAGKYTVFQNAVPDPGKWSGTWRYNWGEVTGRPFYVGGVYFPESAGETNNRRLTGTIHALRVYKWALSDAELEHNRIVDEARFFGNLPTWNVQVAQGKFDASVEAVGRYLVEGTYTFTAEDAVADGKTRRVIGCMVEAWDGSAWGAPTFCSGDSYTYTAGTSPAQVRITWRWQGGGTVLIVR